MEGLAARCPDGQAVARAAEVASWRSVLSRSFRRLVVRHTPTTVCTSDLVHLGQMAEWAGVNPNAIRALVDAGTVAATRHERGGYYFTPLQARSVIAAVQG